MKIAKKHGVESLLPPGRKSTAFKEERILEKGLRVKGTGEGQKVKGHKWERTMSTTLEKRRKAMEEMPEMIRLWKQVGTTTVFSAFLADYHANRVHHSAAMGEVGRNSRAEMYNTPNAQSQAADSFPVSLLTSRTSMTQFGVMLSSFGKGVSLRLVSSTPLPGRQAFVHESPSVARGDLTTWLKLEKLIQI